MTRQEAIAWIEATHGRIFGVEFTKRTDGSTRRMQCRTGVTSHIRGALGSGAAYRPEDHALLLVFDMAKRNYRTIPIEGLTRLEIKGQWHDVTD